MNNQSTPKINSYTLLLQNPVPPIVTDYPRNDKDGNPICKIGFRMLEHEDHIKIQEQSDFECERSFKKEAKDIDKTSDIYLTRYKNISAKHWLFRCCLDPDNLTKSFFPHSDAVGTLPEDEVPVLLKRYLAYSEQGGPIINKMDQKEFNRWVEKIAQDAEQAPNFLGLALPEVQVRFLISMASQLYTLQTDKSSVGTQPEKSTTSGVPTDTTNPNPAK